jgi:sugar/nucleoside kinase (ribokinase family)
VAMGATLGSREEVGRVGRRWELAEAQARGCGGNGGCRTAVLTRGRKGVAIYSLAHAEVR